MANSDRFARDGMQPAGLGGFGRRQVDLSTLAWEFGSVPQQAWPAAPEANLAADISQVAPWLAGTVPGTVQSDLLALGRIADPFLEGNVAACAWVERLDWWYRTTLPLGLDPGQRALLEFDGIDTLSAIYVGDRELARHEGMFSRQAVEIPAEMARQPAAELAVRLWGSAALPHYETSAAERAWGRLAGVAQKSFRPFDDRLATLKAPMHSGWDFAPRLRTMGLWDNARLVICREVYLADLWVQAEPAAAPDPAPARVRVRLTLDSDRPRSLAAATLVRPATFTGEVAFRFETVLDVPQGSSRHELSFDLPEARLWQPWERGEPYLYDLAVQLTAVDDRRHRGAGECLDGASVRFGVRRIERQRTSQGHPWQFVVNGDPLFLRGVNWVPVDALWGRARRSDYEPLLRQAVHAGANFVRVWGGGGREKQPFYDLCDELGLLVWQEFPIACVFLDHLPRRAAFNRLLRQETSGIVRALRTHPSLFLWCGGNEFSPSRNRQAVAVMRQVVAEEDGLRPFVDASPGAGDAHQWQVWHSQAPLAAYREETAAFVSEFGLQAVPDGASLRCFMTEVDLWPPGPSWQTHCADLAKLERYAKWFVERPEAPFSLDAFVLASQRAQAAGLQILVEHVRRRKGQTGGLAVWQWNDPWPAISWSVIDYYGRPKLAYETLRRILQPLLVSLDYPLAAYGPGDTLAGKLWVVNDGREAWPDCRLAVRLDGRLVHELRCDVPGLAAQPVDVVAIDLAAGGAELGLELIHGDTVLAGNRYDLRFHDGGPLRFDRLLRRRLVDAALS